MRKPSLDIYTTTVVVDDHEIEVMILINDNEIIKEEFRVEAEVLRIDEGKLLAFYLKTPVDEFHSVCAKAKAEAIKQWHAYSKNCAA